MPRRALVVAIVPALMLGACGSKSDSSKISDLIKDVGKNPTTLCDKYADAALLAQVGGKAACEKASRAAGASDPNVKVDKVTINGKRATATITGNTGDNTINFVKRGGSWEVVSVAK